MGGPGDLPDPAPEYGSSADGTHYISDTYAHPDGDLHAQVWVAFAYEQPTKILLGWPQDEARGGSEITLDVCFSTPALTKAELIAQTVMTALSAGR